MKLFVNTNGKKVNWEIEGIDECTVNEIGLAFVGLEEIKMELLNKMADIQPDFEVYKNGDEDGQDNSTEEET
ncbi:MAG: hypothetical protein MUP55_03270 [Candidatus Aenigmarchaeota archaeon]|nr:hypothetical protein [Candidatus Aenigmarchaeota archaeon]